MNNGTFISPILSLILLLVACSSPAPTPTPTPSPAIIGSLEVVITGLPSGVAANAEISGPDGFSQTVTASTELKKLKSGIYNIKVNPVTPDSATFSDNGSPASLNFDATAGGKVELKYSCSLVKPPDGGLDQAFQAATRKAQYNCVDLAQLIDELDASEKHIANLEGIQYATGLTSLNLSRNNIISLPSGVFDKLTRLKGLFLSENELSSLEAGIFGQLTSLTRLSLNGNNINSLQTGTFDKLTGLKSLNLTRNKLISLPAGIFDPLTGLTDLSLSQNDLVGLPIGIFDKLINLRSLSLLENKLSSLPSGIFDKLTGLVSLDLSRNNLSSLPASVFDQLTNLTSLSLSQNSLSTLPEGIFAKLTKLGELGLGNNKLVFLPDDFANLGALKFLFLNDNFLTSLPNNLLSKLTKLTSLNIRNNCLPVNQDPLKTQLAGLSGTLFSIGNNPKTGCPQNSITLDSIQAKVLTQNNQILNSETMSFKVRVDGVVQNLGTDALLGVSVKKGSTVTENLSFFVQQGIQVEVFANGSRLGTANLAIDANYSAGPATFSLSNNGATYVVNFIKN